MHKVSNREAAPLIAKREPFTNATRPKNARPGSFRGELEFQTQGHLPAVFLTWTLLGASYVVYSYETPLAWYHDGVWHYASVAYSPTTSEHQHILRIGLKDQNVVYHGGDWREVPGAGRFWDGSPKINASTGTPKHYYGFGPGDGVA